jgi:hypothetical protein
MKYRIDGIDLLIRTLPPDRFNFAIGKQAPAGANGKVRQPPRRPSAVGLCKVTLKTADGHSIIGCSGDRPSYGWLDKRSDRDPLTKLRSLIELQHAARDIWLAKPEFDALFPHWLARHREIEAEGKRRGAEALSASFASAFIERAVTDAVCRAEELSIFDAIKADSFGFQPGLVHDSLKGVDIADTIPARPRTKLSIRHTVGLTDPLTDDELDERVNDGEPESLAEYAERDGLNQYKIKISGNTDRDIERLERIWEILPISSSTALTLDGNEAYTSLQRFSAFVSRLEYESPGLFQHIRFIEQPLTRTLTLDPKTKRKVEQISENIPLIIDEADGTLTAFKEAHALGYSGVSHKNCKGFFKSLLNHALCKTFADKGEWTFLSGEDLSNMPIVPQHQDFAALGVLGLRDCERNGHHYGFGLSHLTSAEKNQLLKIHPDLYEQRGDEIFLRIVDGSVDCGSLQSVGFGVHAEAMPDWSSLTPMQHWLDENYPAASAIHSPEGGGSANDDATGAAVENDHADTSEGLA